MNSVLSAFCVFFLLALHSCAGEGDSAQPNIVGGQLAPSGFLPFMVSLDLFFENQVTITRCTGTLIHPQWILTVAHCGYGQNVKTFRAVMGSTNNRPATNPEAVAVNTTEVYRHPLYNGVAKHYDVALLKLPEPMQLTDKIQTIALAEDNSNLGQQVLYVAGWGSNTTIAGKTVSDLKYLETAEVPFSICKFLMPFLQESLHVCATGTGQGDVCSGDSGGPLFSLSDPTDSSTAVQYGITSFTSFFGCNTQIPSVFTNIAGFARNWALAIISGSTCGNGVLESGEQCDLGQDVSVRNWKESCCNPETCQFIGAELNCALNKNYKVHGCSEQRNRCNASGQCTRRFKPDGTTCRVKKGELGSCLSGSCVSQ